MDELNSMIGKPELLSELIASGFDIESRDDMGCTPLFTFVVAGDLAGVQILLLAGADPNAIAPEPGCYVLAETPLDLAQQCSFFLGRKEYAPIVKALIQAGARD